MTEPNPLHKHDCRVDAVLHALANAEPAETLQARLVAALHAANTSAAMQQRETARPRWWREFAVAGSSVWWAALAACLLMMVSTGLYQFALHRRPVTQAVAAHAVKEWDRPGPADAAVTARATASQRRTAADPFAFKTTAVSAAPARSPRSEVLQPVSCCTRLHEADTASFPPPPLPLTEQERLLLRLRRREPVEQLAQLTRPARDAMFQRDKDAFVEFFAPAPPLRSQQEPPSDAGEPAEQP